MYRLAESMSKLGEPWPDVQDAYLKAWEFRPTRAEALHAIAFRCRVEQRYRLGYLFAQRAAEIPLPEEDLFVPRYRGQSTPGAQPMSRRCAHPGSVSTPRRSRCAGACWPAPTSPSLIGNGLRPTATFRCRP